MGEYAIRKSDGAQVKIGTCESMYYLRADQIGMVDAQGGSCDVGDPEVWPHVRFRFPFPDEDNILPGDFHSNNYERGITAEGYKAPADTEHYNVQFSGRPGYLVSLPCPESKDAGWLRIVNPDNTTTPVAIHRNGFPGAVQLVQQKILADGRRVPVLRCACGALWRVEDPSEIEALAVAFRSEGDRKEALGSFNGTGKQDRKFYDAIADRILEGARMHGQLVLA